MRAPPGARQNLAAADLPTPPQPERPRPRCPMAESRREAIGPAPNGHGFSISWGTEGGEAAAVGPAGGAVGAPRAGSGKRFATDKIDPLPPPGEGREKRRPGRDGVTAAAVPDSQK